MKKFTSIVLALIIALSVATVAFAETPEPTLADQVSDFIAGIDFKEVFSKVVDFLGGLDIAGFVAKVIGFINDAISKL